MRLTMPCVFLVMFSGLVSYTIIAIVFSKSEYYKRRLSYDPLMFGYINPRPPNSYLREPRKLLEHVCDKDPCLQNKSVNFTLVTFIKSKANYFQRRELLRRTWNAVSYMNGGRFEAVFLMGKTSHPATLNLLDVEEERYGDILQYDGPDDYDLMPYKVLAGMEWASKHLPSNTLYASADDDFLIDIRKMTHSIQEVMLNATKRYNSTLPIMCMFIKGLEEKPLRVQGWKWYVSYDEYRPNIYPPYCHGGMYVMSLPLAKDLYNTSLVAPMLRLDDVWITGILRRRLNFSDHLVLKMPEVTKHFGSVNDAVRAAMSKKWDEMKRTFENTTQCQCTL
uniref:Hexosyltransferase n=1 Tax=Phallusia mammillata TaxID=59560 RepID=A0A6F9D7X1_9ASCI|nr:Not3 protein [Phallusia mammillata]